MKRLAGIFVFTSLVFISQGQRSDVELSRDSILAWSIVPKAQVYKPVKDNLLAGSNYTTWQQQISDTLVKWVQQSYLQRGSVVRMITKNNERWWVGGAPPLHTYGFNFLGFEARFVNGKLDLKCCELGPLLDVAFNEFPGDYLTDFNPGGLHFLAEQAAFSSGDDEAKLASEGIDKKIQPNLYGYRTYLNHYHDNGNPFNNISIVIPKNGEWPFKPVLVKDIAGYITQQMAAFPGIEQKNPYDVKAYKDALERLKPYYNEVAKLKNNFNYGQMINDDKGHSLLDPNAIINGKSINKTFPEYRILVSTTQQVIDQTKSDKPLWFYMNLTKLGAVKGNPVSYDPAFCTAGPWLVYSLLRNFNFDYVSKWLSQPEALKGFAYKPLQPLGKAANNMVAAVKTSPAAAAKNKDPYTILYEDFDGYATGTFSAQGWHTYGYAGHEFANATLSTIAGQPNKWISIPDQYTFYPDFVKPLPASFSVNYDIYFGEMKNKRSPIYFRLDTYDSKKSGPIDLKDMNRNGFQFSMALSGESETSKRFVSVADKETLGSYKITGLKQKDVAHVNITVNGSNIAVSVNGREVMHDDNALPAGKSFRRYAWYCGVPEIYIGNIFVKSATPVQPSDPKDLPITQVPKTKNENTGSATSFESIPYVPATLPKAEVMMPVNYPQGFKSAVPTFPTGSNKVNTAFKPGFKSPAASPLLGGLSNMVLSETSFKNFINDLTVLVSNKLKSENVAKIDAYFKAKKITGSRAIGVFAIDAWAHGKPTAALYTFCKALQADQNDKLTANNLASLLIEYGYAEKAIPVLQYINKQNNNIPEVLANFSNAYYNLGDNNTAMDFAGRCIAKDSNNTTANKVAAFVYLNKNDKSSTEKAIGCLKQALKDHYDKEASDFLNKIEANHQTAEDYPNTNWKQFPLLKRITLPTMPSDLKQARSFNIFLQTEQSALSETSDKVFGAYKKIPVANSQQKVNMLESMKTQGTYTIMVKANMILSTQAAWYAKMKKDLEDIFTQRKKELTAAFNNKVNPIMKKYNDERNKLEGGEGNAEEEEKIEELMKARCEAYNKEAAIYLTDLAQLTNQFAQQSEYVSRSYYRDYANWAPMAQLDSSNAPFLLAQTKYLQDVNKILSLYAAVEPCIYPGTETDKKGPVTPKQWEEQYCANFKGVLGLGAAKVAFSCNSISISGGEGFVGDLSFTYDEAGKFKEMTIGAGVGAEAHWGNQNITSVSAGASVMEYITIGSGPGGNMQVTDFGITAGVGASGNIGAAGADMNIASTTLSVTSGVSASGALPNALGLK